MSMQGFVAVMANFPWGPLGHILGMTGLGAVSYASGDVF